MDFLPFFVWSMVVFGFVNGVVNSSLLLPFTAKLANDSSIVVSRFGQLLWCPMCLGFWVGIGLSLLWFSPVLQSSQETFPLPSFWAHVFDGFLGSSISWSLSGLTTAFFKVGSGTGGCGGCNSIAPEEESQ